MKSRVCAPRSLGTVLGVSAPENLPLLCIDSTTESRVLVRSQVLAGWDHANRPRRTGPGPEPESRRNGVKPGIACLADVRP